jgi:hypothetical protein
MAENFKIPTAVFDRVLQKVEGNWIFVTGLFAFLFFILGFMAGSKEVRIESFSIDRFYYNAGVRAFGQGPGYWSLIDKRRKCLLAHINHRKEDVDGKSYYQLNWSDLEQSFTEFSLSLNRWDSIPKLGIVWEAYSPCDKKPLVRYASEIKR